MTRRSVKPLAWKSDGSEILRAASYLPQFATEERSTEVQTAALAAGRPFAWWLSTEPSWSTSDALTDGRDLYGANLRWP